MLVLMFALAIMKTVKLSVKTKTRDRTRTGFESSILRRELVTMLVF